MIKIFFYLIFLKLIILFNKVYKKFVFFVYKIIIMGVGSNIFNLVRYKDMIWYNFWVVLFIDFVIFYCCMF